MLKLKTAAAKTLEYSFYALFFFTPLILWPKTSEIFEFNKMIIVYLLTIIIVSSQAVIWTANKKISLRRTPLDIPILLFLLSQVLSTVFSIHPFTSLWGYYSRWHGSLASTISYILLYYIFINNFFKQRKFQNITYSILASSILVSIYAVLEKLGIDKNLWVQDVQNRVFSSLGQPNWLASYLLALLPLSAYLALNTKNKNLTIFYSFITINNLISIIFTKSQSGIGATAIILIFISTHLCHKHKKLPQMFLLLLLSLLSSYLFKPSLISKPLASLNKINPFYSTTTQIVKQDLKERGNGGSDSMAIRRVVWQGAIKLGLKNPLFGTGVETFAYSYYQARPKDHNLLSEWDFLYNKAHNEYLNYFATTGFLGIATYLLLIIWFITWYLKLKVKNLISPALFFGWISILITNFFGFSVVITGLYFFTFPALIIARQNKLKNINLSLKIHPIVLLVIIAASTIYPLSLAVNYWNADILYTAGKNNLSAGNMKKSLDLLKKAHKLSPRQAIYTAALGKAQAQTAATINAQLNSPQASLSASITNQAEKIKQDLLSQALKNLDLAISQNSHHTIIYKTRASSQLYLSTIDPKYSQQALDTLLNLNKLAPTDAKVIYNIGLIYQSLNQPSQAKQAYKKAVELKPNYTTAKAQLQSL